MRGPLVFLVWQSLVNRILSMLRKMKRPKYAISVLFGAGYIWWFMIRPMSQVGQVSAFDGGQAAHTLIVQSVVGLLFIVMLLLQTLSSERGLAYQENELLFLLVAPVSRAGLLRLKLIQSQPGILLSSMFMGYVVYRMPGGSFWAFPGMYLLVNLMTLFRTWWSLTLCALHQRGITIWMGWVGLLLIAGIAVAAKESYEPIEQIQLIKKPEPGNKTAGPPEFDTEPIADYLVSWIGREPLADVLQPLRLTVAVATPGSWRHRLAGLALLSVWFGLLGLLVFSSRTDFVQPSLQLANRVARIKTRGFWAARREAKGAKKKRPKLSPPPFELKPGGRLWVAFFWKNLLCAGSKYTPRVFGYAMLVAVGGGLTLGLWPGMDPKIQVGVSGMVVYALFLYSLILSNMVRNDLRRDIPNFIYIRSLPISGFQLLFGSVLGPTVIVAGLATVGWSFCICAVWVMGDIAVPLLFKIPVYFAGVMSIYALAFAFVCVENCLALTYPGWVQLGPVQQGGFDKMGQNMLSMIVRMFMMLICLIPPAIVGVPVCILGVWLAGGSLVGTGWAVLGTALVAVPILVAEFVALLWFCGQTVYPKFDISAELV